jgi:RNA polymerase sigma-70 factor, ECF subfamily
MVPEKAVNQEPTIESALPDRTATEKTPSDESLMLQFQEGSREAFEQLFARYRAPLFALFRRRLPTDNRAEDLAQDTFVAVVTSIDRYRPRALVRTYLYGIAFNLLAAERRKQFRDAPSSRAGSEPSTRSDSTQVLWLRQAFARLDDSEREILMLREFEQLSYAEIAELLLIPINTVRSRLFRARMTLKNYLVAENSTAVARTLDPSQPGTIAELSAAEEEGLS